MKTVRIHKSHYVLIVLFLSIVASPAAAEERLALVDFEVHSDKPQYSYLGKGISEMIAVELSKSPGVALIEREKRVELMKEVKFALSGLAEDTDKQVEVGRMLAADYFVFGEIVDMDPQLLISIRVTGVESGETVFREKLTEKPGRYEYISGYFASAILRHFDAEVAESTEKKTKEKADKNEEAVVAFSQALEAYDRDEKGEAKRELKRAKSIDPGYEAAKVYLQKLESISPKFRVETDYYAPTTNPAYLGMLDKDMLYFWAGSSLSPPSADENEYQEVDEYLFKEYPSTTRFGYALPVGDRLGFSVEYDFGAVSNWINAPNQYDVEGTLDYESKSSYYDNGASIAAGYSITEAFGLGTSVHLFTTKPTSGGTVNLAEEDFRYGAALGFLYSISGGKYIFDLQVSYDNDDDWYLDEEKNELKSGTLPLIVDGSFISSFFDNRLVTALKGIGDLYTDARGGNALRAIPMAEYWVLPFLSLRGGYEYVHLQQAGSFTIGHGFLAGVSVKLDRFDLNFNYTLRKKPSRQVPGYLIEDSYLLLGLTYAPGWIARE